MSGYIGVQPVPQATQRREYFTATNGQTTFNTNGYTPNYIDVYMNGVKLSPADFTASNGSDVVLASGATTGDLVQVVSFTPFNVANQTFIGDVNLSSGAYKIGGNTVIDSSRNATFATVGTPAGSAAAPAYTFSTDTNTGMFKRGTDQIGFSAGGTEYVAMGSFGLAVDTIQNKASAGNLTLDVAGELIIDTDLQGTGNGVILKDDGIAYGSFFRSSSNLHIKAEASDQDMLFMGNDNGSEITALTLDMSEAGAATFNSSITATGLTVDNGSSGQSKITVSEGGADNRNLVLYSAASGASAKIAVEGTTADLDFVVNNGSQTAMTIDGATGNVGIGDTGPTSLLSIKKDSTRTTDYENMLKITHTSSGTTGIGFGSAIYFLGERENGALQGMGRLVFDAEVNSGTDISSGFSVQTATAGTPSEKLRVTHDGNVGIGIQNPPKALTVFRANQTDDTTVALLKLHAQFADSSIEQTDKVAIQFAVQNSGGGIQTSDAIKFSYNNNLYLMEDGGDVAIGNVSDPSARLDISAASSTAFGAQALKVRDGSHTTIQMDSGAADGRIQVGAAGTLRGVYKAQHAGTQTDHPFSLIQDNSSRLTIRDDRSVAHIDSGYRFDLGFFPAPSNTYQHFKTDCQKSNHMLFFEYKGYSYSSGGAVLTAMTVYAYTGTSGPYDPLYTRYGHNTANGFVNCYYSSDGYLVLVLKTNHTNGYTGGWMWAQSGNNFTDSNIRMLAQTSTSSNSGAY